MNSTSIQPYLFFNGRCEEAIEFYRTALGAEVGMLMRFRENPDTPPPGTVPEGWDDKVMHAELKVGGGMIMMSDGCETTAGFEGFCLALNVATADEATRFYHALCEGGKITMPLGETFWSACFGMVTDRFGIGWMVGAEPAAPES